MSAAANSGWNARNEKTPGAMTVGTVSLPNRPAEAMTHNRVEALRDTLLVLGLQLVFRATLILRRWNW
jgi:hypothetical protein